jgi:prepilin-type N-terminal cleavage/methylation domain-containing protein
MMNMSEKGFTLIEILVAITIMMIIFALSIPAYNNYASSQAIKTTAIKLKNDIRVTQNKALNGIKNNSVDPAQLRAPWVVLLTGDGTFYDTFSCPEGQTVSYCRVPTFNAVRTKLGNNLEIKLCTSPGCTTTYTGVLMFFAPIDGTVQFYRYEPANATSNSVAPGTSPLTEIAVDTVSIRVQKVGAASGTVFTVNSKGQVVENSQ